MRTDNADSWRSFAALLRNEREIIVVGHRNPDGDCLGTMSALAVLVHHYGNKARLLSADPVPQHYVFLPFMNDVEIIQQADCNGCPVVLLECGTVERCGIELAGTGRLVNLDHHPDNSRHGDILLLRASASSVGEMVTRFLMTEADVPHDAILAMATALYVAIHTDTGGFSYGNTSEQALKAAAFLVSAGADVEQACAAVYQSQPANRLKLKGQFLTRLQTRENGRIGLGWLFLSDLEQFGCGPQDTDGFSAYPRAIEGVEIGIFLLETEPGRFKVSLRSKGNIVVNKTAGAFGGGGHAKAAGFQKTGDLQTIVEETIRSLRESNDE